MALMYEMVLLINDKEKVICNSINGWAISQKLFQITCWPICIYGI